MEGERKQVVSGLGKIMTVANDHTGARLHTGTHLLMLTVPRCLLLDFFLLDYL